MMHIRWLFLFFSVFLVISSGDGLHGENGVFAGKNDPEVGSEARAEDVVGEEVGGRVD